MKAITKASRVNTALQVIQHMNAGMTVVEACRAVGIPRSSFYYIMENNPEAIAEVQDIINTSNREQLVLMLVSQNELLRKVIEDGMSDKTKPRDRLAIFMKLNELVNSFTQSQHIESEIERQAQEFLKRGPILKVAKSRFTARETTVTIESEE